MSEDICTLRILRGSPGNQYWEEFAVHPGPGENVISALMKIQKSPVTSQGKKVTPVAWEQGCLEEVCGSCSMLVNGHPRQACTAILSRITEASGKKVITLAPLTKFPLVRDLVVDRSSMFANLKRVKAWIESDGAYDRGLGPTVSQRVQEVRYSLATCMTCGCCSEACPQVNDKSAFMGPAPIAQVRFCNSHPTGKMTRRDRLLALMDKGGVHDCGNAQNCVRVCPKGVPLTDAIAAAGRDTTLQSIREVLSLPEREPD